MDRRLTLMLAAGPAGLTLGAFIWLLHAPGGDGLAALDARLAAVAARPPARAEGPGGGAMAALAAPLFALTTGAGAVSEVTLKLEGLVRAPGRMAALLSINGGPSDWLAAGQSRDGVTLQEVYSSKVVVDTALGLKDVPLQAAGSAAGSGPVSDPRAGPVGPLSAPAGFRQPPEPASAPKGP